MKFNFVPFFILIQIFLLLSPDYAKGADQAHNRSNETEESSESINTSYNFTEIRETIYTQYPFLKDLLPNGNSVNDCLVDLGFLNKMFETASLKPLTTYDEKTIKDALKIFAFEIAQKYKNNNDLDPNIKKEIQRYLQIGDLIVPTELRNEIRITIDEGESIIKTNIEEFYTELKKENINSPDRDAELQNKWKILSEKVGSQVMPIFKKYFGHIEAMLPLGKRVGITDPISLWKYICSDIDFFSTKEIKKIWNQQLKTPYLQLMSYMRKDFKGLYTYYNGIEKDDGPMPAYIFDLIQIAHSPHSISWAPDLTNNQIDERFSKLFNVKRQSVKRISTKTLTRKVQQYFESLGFPKLEKFFWENSIFIDNADEERPKITVEILNDKCILHVRARVTQDTPDKIFQALYEVHRTQLTSKNNYSEILSDMESKTFKKAFLGALIEGFASIKTMAKFGLVKGEASQDERLEFFKGSGIKDFTILASVMTLTTWEYDIMEKKIRPKKWLSQYWERRLEYEFVVPTTYSSNKPNTSALYDFFQANQIFVDGFDFSNFAFKILRFQIYARFCELAGEYTPNQAKISMGLLHSSLKRQNKLPEKQLFECDYSNNPKVGKLIRTVVEYGGMKTWRELLDIIMGTQNAPLSATGFLDYYEPLLKKVRTHQYNAQVKGANKART